MEIAGTKCVNWALYRQRPLQQALSSQDGYDT